MAVAERLEGVRAVDLVTCRTGEKVDIADTGLSGRRFPAKAACFCAFIVSFKVELVVDITARGLEVGPGPTLLVNAAVVGLGFAASLSSNCFDFGSSVVMILLTLAAHHDQ